MSKSVSTQVRLVSKRALLMKKSPRADPLSFNPKFLQILKQGLYAIAYNLKMSHLNTKYSSRTRILSSRPCCYPFRVSKLKDTAATSEFILCIQWPHQPLSIIPINVLKFHFYIHLHVLCWQVGTL